MDTYRKPMNKKQPAGAYQQNRRKKKKQPTNSQKQNAHRKNPQTNRRPVNSKEYKKWLKEKKRKRRMKRRRFMLILLLMCVAYFLLPGFTEKVGEARKAVPASAQAIETKTAENKPQHTEKKIETSARNKSSEYLILVNKTHAIDADYEPSDLVQGKPNVEGANRYQQLRKIVQKAFRNLSRDASEKGYTIKITSGYRPYAYQKQIFEKYVNMDGRYSAEQYSAEPGHSEHQTGLCADVSSPSVNYNLAQAYGTTAEGQWLAKNAHKYGFIIRFPKGKEKITGYEYEPWHIRYVGKAAAKEIYKQNLTLEEYLEAE